MEGGLMEKIKLNGLEISINEYCLRMRPLVHTFRPLNAR